MKKQLFILSCLLTILISCNDNESSAPFLSIQLDGTVWEQYGAEARLFSNTPFVPSGYRGLSIMAGKGPSSFEFVSIYFVSYDDDTVDGIETGIYYVDESLNDCIPVDNFPDDFCESLTGNYQTDDDQSFTSGTPGMGPGSGSLDLCDITKKTISGSFTIHLEDEDGVLPNKILTGSFRNLEYVVY